MSRYIDADKIDFNECFVGQSDFARDTREAAQNLIDKQPTADVEIVVRCSKCKFFNILEHTTDGFRRCDVDHLWQPLCDRPYRKPSDFCSRGAQMDEEVEQ